MKYSTRILVVDLEHKKSSVMEVDGSVSRAYIGGAGLGAKILWDETSGVTEPFSPENRLMFMIGPLTGKVPQSSRAIVCGLSPLNNAWGEAAMGGSWGSEFSNTGFSGIVVSGRAKKPVYLYLKDKEVSINDAGHLWGKDTFEVTDILQKETDEKASVAAIGPAGENQSRIAGIVGDGRFGRVAARCGLGGVMGSKNLKAVVVRGTGKQKAVDEAGLRAASKVVTQLLARIKSGALGPLNLDTNVVIARLNNFGTLGVKNKSMGRWDAFRDKFHESFEHGKQYHCRLCPISCIESHVIHDARQMVMHMIMSVGANCLIDDIDALQQGYESCNRYGIDNISFGYTLSFAMEAYEKGLINQKDTGGIELTWGNHKAMLEVLRQIGENEGFGKVLGQGSLRAARQIGGEALQYAMQVKGLEVPYFDPRIFNSLALAYATGNRGGSHYESPSHQIERRNPEAGFGIDLAEFGYPQGVSRLGLPGKADIVKKIQDIVCLLNSLVVCEFSYTIYGVRIANYLSCLNAAVGWDMSAGEFLQVGERIFNLKRLINLRQGLNSADDTLPQRFLAKLTDLSAEEQRVPSSLGEYLQEYYALRGWSQDGIPTEGKRKELDLPRC